LVKCSGSYVALSTSTAISSILTT